MLPCNLKKPTKNTKKKDNNKNIINTTVIQKKKKKVIIIKCMYIYVCENTINTAYKNIPNN